LLRLTTAVVDAHDVVAVCRQSTGDGPSYVLSCTCHHGDRHVFSSFNVENICGTGDLRSRECRD
jgi:hypothetical protein